MSVQDHLCARLFATRAEKKNNMKSRRKNTQTETDR